MDEYQSRYFWENEKQKYKRKLQLSGGKEFFSKSSIILKISPKQNLKENEKI